MWAQRDYTRKAALEDVRDGTAFQANAFFASNPGAISILLYSDAVEVVNPIGPGRCKHKIVQVFWSIGDLPRMHRSQIDKLQLCLVFKEKYLKKYGYQMIFGRLLDDLCLLEEEGILVYKPFQRTVKAGLLLYSADNLEVGCTSLFIL